MKKLYRSRKDKKFSGLCGGIAEYFGLDSSTVRLGVLALVLLAGSGLLFYIIASCIVPEAPADDSFVSYYNNEDSTDNRHMQM